MPDMRINQLEAIGTITGDELFVAEQNSQAKKMTASDFNTWLAGLYQANGYITSITGPVSESNVDTYTIHFSGTQDTVSFSVTNGVGIESIGVAYGIASQADPSYVQAWDTSVIPPTEARPYAFTRLTITDSIGGQTVAYSVAKSPNPEIRVGDVTAISGPEAGASVRESGTYYNPTWNFDFVLPQGDKGDKGDYVYPSIEYGKSASGSTEPTDWWGTPPNLSSGDYLWERINYIVEDPEDPENPQTLRTVTHVVGYIGQNGTGSGTVTQVTFNSTPFTPDGTGNVSIEATAAMVGAIAVPSDAPTDGQVLTYDANSGQWAPRSPTTGGVNTVNGQGADVGTTNITLYATNIKMSSSDNTTIPNAIPKAATNAPADLGTAAVGSSTKWAKEDHVHKLPSASDVGAVSSSDVQYKIYNSVSDIGLTVGSADIGAAFSALPTSSILYAYWTDFPTSQLPGNYIGVVEIIKTPTGGGKIFFHGQTTAYGEGVMYLNSSNQPSGTWENPAKQNNLAGTDLVDLSSYTSTRYVFPGDGFIFINNNNTQTGSLIIYGAGQTTGYIRLGNAVGYYSCFVKKGMQCSFSGSSNTARYAKLS